MEEIQKATKERKQNKLLRTLKSTFTVRRIVIGVVVVILAVGTYLIANSSIFSIAEVEITGGNKQLSYVNPSNLKEGMGEIVGSNYFAVNIEDISQSIISQSTYIKSALVYKTFPDTISIQIIEREPKFVLETQAKCVLLDKTGFVLLITQAESCSGNIGYTVLPLIKAELPNHTFLEGQNSSLLITSEMADIITLLKYYGYTGNILELNDNVLTVSDEASHKFIFSISQNIDTQLARFISISSSIEDDVVGFRSLDLRYKKPVLVPTE